MHAAYFNSTGGADVIKFGELPRSALLPGTVLVRVAAAAVDHVDTFVRAGTYSTKLVFPQVPGRDMVGTVEQLGPGTNNAPANFHVGNPVWSNSMGFGGRAGTAAEFTAVPRGRLYHLPAGVEHCLDLGAQVALDYRSPTFGQDLRAAVERVSGGRVVDVHLETSGRHRLGLAVDLLALRGRIVVLPSAMPLLLNWRTRRPPSMVGSPTRRFRYAMSPPFGDVRAGRVWMKDYCHGIETGMDSPV